MTAIAIVDDDQRLVSALRLGLSRKGFDVLVADATNKAIKLIRDNKIDVLLTDLRMSGRDGIDLIREVRAISPNTRSILMSAYATANDYKAAMELGAVDVIVKPFTPDELELVIDKALSTLPKGASGDQASTGQKQAAAELSIGPSSNQLSNSGDAMQKAPQTPPKPTNLPKVLYGVSSLASAALTIAVLMMVRPAPEPVVPPTPPPTSEVTIDVTDWIKPASKAQPKVIKEVLKPVPAPVPTKVAVKKKSTEPKKRRWRPRRRKVAKKVTPKKSQEVEPAEPAAPVKAEPSIGTVSRRPAIGVVGAKPAIGAVH